MIYEDMCSNVKILFLYTKSVIKFLQEKTNSESKDRSLKDLDTKEFINVYQCISSSLVDVVRSLSFISNIECVIRDDRISNLQDDIKKIHTDIYKYDENMSDFPVERKRFEAMYNEINRDDMLLRKISDELEKILEI